MGYINQNIRAMREHRKILQQTMADKVGKKRSTYATYELDVQPSHDLMQKIASVLKVDVLDLYKEDFISNIKGYEPKGKKTSSKQIDVQSHVAHSIIKIEAMVRVLLRSHAEIIAAQQKESVTKVLGELTKAVRDETLEEFGEL